METGANVTAREEPADELPMGMMEAIILFGGLAIILDGIGAVFMRLNGITLPLCACLNIFLYAGAGFVAARHWTVANGVWAGIAVAAIDAVIGQMLIMAVMPEYREAASGGFGQLPASALLIILPLYVLGTLIGVMICGSLFGVIGAAISHSGPFRPRYRYGWEIQVPAPPR